jgi:hypothetical protein
VVYSTQEYRDSGLHPSQGILKNIEEHNALGNWICFHPQVKGSGDAYSVGSVRKSRGCKHNQFHEQCVILCYLEYQTMDEVGKFNNPEEVFMQIIFPPH